MNYAKTHTIQKMSFQALKDYDTKMAIAKEAFKSPYVVNKPKNEFDITDIVFDDSYDTSRNSDLWYRGWIASIVTTPYTFNIEAIGDQDYSLYVTDWKLFEEQFKQNLSVEDMADYKMAFLKNDPILEFRNKGNGGNTFYDVFQNLFKNDSEFYKLLGREEDAFLSMAVGNNNWLEISATNREGEVVYLTDPFSSLDIGSNVLEELSYILSSIPELTTLADELKRQPLLER